MSPRQEEYDASADAFDTKAVYIAIDQMVELQQTMQSHIVQLKRAAHLAARALDDEREKTRRLMAQLARWESRDAAQKP